MYDNSKAHWTQSDLIDERGWTRTLIDRHLGTPDSYEANPHHDRGALVRLYERDRVLAAEQIDTVHDDLVRVGRHREARRAGARRAVHTRRERRDQRAALGIIEFGFNS